MPRLHMKVLMLEGLQGAPKSTKEHQRARQANAWKGRVRRKCARRSASTRARPQDRLIDCKAARMMQTDNPTMSYERVAGVLVELMVRW